MLSLNNILKNVTSYTINLQSVRWRRKPRWVPMAKSRMFKVIPKPILPEDEKEELKRLYNNYRNQIKSIRRHLISKYGTSASQAVEYKDQQQLFEDFARCSKLNDEWNSAVGRERENYFEDALEKQISMAKETLMKNQNLRSLQLEQAEKIVREQKEAAKTFITAENIEAAIEHALANPVDYNFAIDMEGNRYYNKKS